MRCDEVLENFLKATPCFMAVHYAHNGFPEGRDGRGSLWRNNSTCLLVEVDKRLSLSLGANQLSNSGSNRAKLRCAEAQSHGLNLQTTSDGTFCINFLPAHDTLNRTAELLIVRKKPRGQTTSGGQRSNGLRVCTVMLI